VAALSKVAGVTEARTPDAGRAVSPWIGVGAVGHPGSVVRAELPVDDAQALENAIGLAQSRGIDVDDLLGEEELSDDPPR